MAQMIRKQIYIDDANEQFLKRRSSELGLTEAEIIRQALTEAERQAETHSRKQALADLLTYIREHRMYDTPQTCWKFNREELYEERIDRIGRRPGDVAKTTGE